MKNDIVLYDLLKSPWHFLQCIAIITSLQLLPLFFAQRKAKTRREKLKAVSAIMTFQFNWMEIPVFCRISTGIHPPADQLLPHLLASSRESPTGDLDPLCSAINLRILYGTEKRFKKMFDCLGGLALFSTHFETYCHLSWMSRKSRNHEQNVWASLKLGVALYYFVMVGIRFILKPLGFV